MLSLRPARADCPKTRRIGLLGLRGLLGFSSLLATSRLMMLMGTLRPFRTTVDLNFAYWHHDGLALLTGLLFGLAPRCNRQSDLNHALKRREPAIEEADGSG